MTNSLSLFVVRATLCLDERICPRPFAFVVVVVDVVVVVVVVVVVFFVVVVVVVVAVVVVSVIVVVFVGVVVVAVLVVVVVVVAVVGTIVGVGIAMDVVSSNGRVVSRFLCWVSPTTMSRSCRRCLYEVDICLHTYDMRIHGGWLS